MAAQLAEELQREFPRGKPFCSAIFLWGVAPVRPHDQQYTLYQASAAGDTLRLEIADLCDADPERGRAVLEIDNPQSHLKGTTGGPIIRLADGIRWNGTPYAPREKTLAVELV
eukprot:gnl/Hemi2/5311_TR1836_c0_g1_i1.p2 gnl/Hemi2/5311_TR1836_c0_g1~~gnl/Hemi2/5311_TR1836_c0_g1_i1.p2  ORF type:complete len:132 (+),score=41.60 gnl/Hemi2/5311_TR1836_c0_g1_i1:58-396(+)